MFSRRNVKNVLSGRGENIFKESNFAVDPTFCLLRQKLFMFWSAVKATQANSHNATNKQTMQSKF